MTLLLRTFQRYKIVQLAREICAGENMVWELGGNLIEFPWKLLGLFKSRYCQNA